MTEIDAAGRAERAHSRLAYLADLKLWLDGYIKELDKAEHDAIVPVDPNIKGACMALKNRMIRMILEDAVEVAEVDINGKTIWEKPEF